MVFFGLADMIFQKIRLKITFNLGNQHHGNSD